MGSVVAPKEDIFHSQSLNQLKPNFNYINKPPLIRAQITARPTTRDVPSSYFKPNTNSLLPMEVNHLGKRPDDSEISIFDADKYFNGAHDPRRTNNNNNNHKNDSIYTISNLKQPSITRLSLSSTPKQSISSIQRLSSVSDDSYGRTYRARPSHATPTASSEASWNSKTGLLTNPPGLAPVSIRNLPNVAHRTTGRKTSASIRWFLRRNRCPCSGKKSVNVSQSNSETETTKTPPPPPPPPRIVQLNRISCGGSDRSLYSSRQSSPRITNTNPNLDDRVAVTVKTFADASGTTSNGFTFPILNTSATPPKRMFNIVVPPITVATPRESLEVFRPQEGGEGRSFTFPTSPKSRRASYEEEMCSDASSDLFEIESFSTTTQSTLISRLEDPSSSTFSVRRLQIAALNKAAAGDEEEEVEEEEEEWYAPSEVSVDWSVTTAEGFDRGGVAGFPVSASEDSGRRRGGLLTSCRREKAVSVGPGPIKCRQVQRGGM